MTAITFRTGKRQSPLGALTALRAGRTRQPLRTLAASGTGKLRSPLGALVAGRRKPRPPLARRVVGAAAIGAGALVLLDPRRGRRRRAAVRDRAVRAAHIVREGGGATARDLRNRSYGLVARTRRPFRRRVDDAVLEERVRTALGWAVRRPGSIDVTAEGGRVTLSGPILADEVPSLIGEASSVRGVREIVDELEVHDEPGNVPGLQGSGKTREPQFELRQRRWSPAARLLTAAGGAAATAYGLRRRGIPGAALAAGGGAVLLRGLTNLPLDRLTGIGAGRRAIVIQKHVNVDVPVGDVFALWSHPENFPSFMTNVKEVSEIGEGRYRWRVAGPGGVPVQWDAVVTKLVENEVIAWRSEPGSIVRHAGLVRFLPNERAGTRVDIRLSYNPPAGAVGHAIATLLRTAPKERIEQEMVRLKTVLEQGKVPSDAARRR